MPSLCTVFALIRRERQSWCCWDCGLRLCRDRTSCAAVVTAILQCCTRFDLTTLVFEEQGFFFFALLLPSKWIVWFNQVENASQEEKGAFFPLPPGLWAFFCGQRQSPFPPPPTNLQSLKSTFSHWLGFICWVFVVTEDDTVTALSGAVSCEGRSPNSPGVNPIVFSPM